MHVRKFEGETLDEALKAVKSELGPEAIILKTNTFKGLKGSLKKKRYEITAAISEEDYTKKSKVDNLLDSNQKESFYTNSSRNISKVINSYGNISLNKSVAQIEETHVEKNSLSDFLGEEEKNNVQAKIHANNEQMIDVRNNVEIDAVINKNRALELQVNNQNRQIDLLKQELNSISEQVIEIKRSNNPNSKASELKDILRSFDLSENLIFNVMRKAKFELSNDELEDEELLYDLTFRELKELIKTKTALFTHSEVANQGVVTVILGDGATGQSAMAMKMASLAKNGIIIEYNDTDEDNSKNFARTMLGVKVEQCKNLQELTSKLRENIDLGKKVFIDLNCCNYKKDHSKKITQAIRNTFKNVEVLLSLSAIHSELYNKRMCNKYSGIVDGLVVSHLDQCLNLSALINLQFENSSPYVFFGNGRVVPKDIEEAQSDRLISEIFNL